MKRILLLALLAGAGVLAYRHFVVDAPVRAGLAFLQAWAREDTPEAAAMTDGDAAKTSVETHILRGVCRAPMEALRGSHASLDSRTTAGGDVVLTMRQIVRFDPPGMTTGIGGAMSASFRHVLRMRKTDSGWKVAAFQPEFLDAVETRKR